MSVPWRGRETGNVAISCLLPPFGDESAGLFGQPCFRIDEEHATAEALNAEERVESRLVNARRVRGCGEVARC